MVEVDGGRFTIGVFKDVESAEQGLKALARVGLPATVLSVLAKESVEATTLVEQTLGGPAERIETSATGPLVAKGPLLDSIQGPARDLNRLGLSGTLRRVGFQAHDGRIFEALTARGGVLVAVLSESRAADALAVMFSYGGGNAAIGAWTGRV
jgi:hypothetical protein